MYRRSGERARNDTRRTELVEFTELFGVLSVISARLGARMAPEREGRCVIRSSNRVERIPTGPEGSLEYAFGLAARERYWRILERSLAELGYHDGLGAVQRYRSEHPREVETSPRGRVACRAFGRRPEHQIAGDAMNPTKALHALGQSLWLDNITRDLLKSGTLQRYIDTFSVTGLTSNPTIFDHAIRNSTDYDRDISQNASRAATAENLFFELALADLTRAAELFQPIFNRSDGVDGWVSLEVSPSLAHSTDRTLAAVRNLHQRSGKPNLFIKIPGTAEGLPAIEGAIFEGIPVNVTLLFSREQYLAAADAYLRGVERRIEAGLNPAVASVASLFVSRWDVAVSGKVPGELTNRLGVAIAKRTYKAYQEFLASARLQRALNAGARAQRLLWASTGTKAPNAPDTLYVRALAAPFTINTMPEATLKAFGDHGEVGAMLTPDGGDCETVLAAFDRAGIDVDDLACRLQNEGASSFVRSWNDLIACIEAKSARVRKAG
jgi:transaldolase